MKHLVSSILLSIGLIFPTYALSKDPPKAEPKVEQKAEEGAGKGEMKRVCHPKKDKEGKEVKDKAGKVVEECKDIKVRKKLEGHEIPAKDKK